MEKRKCLLFGDLNSGITKEETQPKGKKGTEATIKSKVKGERKKIPLTLLQEAKKLFFIVNKTKAELQLFMGPKISPKIIGGLLKISTPDIRWKQKKYK